MYCFFSIIFIYMITINTYLLEKLHLDKDIQISNKITFSDMRALIFAILTNKIGNSSFNLMHEENTNRLEINIIKKGINLNDLSSYVTTKILEKVEEHIGRVIYTRTPKIVGKTITLYFDTDKIDFN